MTNPQDETLDQLVNVVKPIPEAPVLSIEKPILINGELDNSNIIKLQDYERNLVKLDRLFISRGLRFVLIIPILVIIVNSVIHIKRSFCDISQSCLGANRNIYPNDMGINEINI